MRRPADVKAHFRFLLPVSLSHFHEVLKEKFKIVRDKIVPRLGNG